MIDLAYPFRVATGTSRRPTPLKYEHLRKFVEKDETFQVLRSEADIVNINQQLEQTANLFVSNVISRVIAQLIGFTAKGFVTIKSSDDGALHVFVKGSDADLATHVAIDAGTEHIGEVGLEGYPKTPLKAKIDFAGGGTDDTIDAAPGVKHKVTFIMLTVGGQTNLKFKDDDGDFTGGMDFGGADEPRGMVASHGLIPLETGVNKHFQIVSSAAVQVSGYVLYYDEA